MTIDTMNAAPQKSVNRYRDIPEFNYHLLRNSLEYFKKTLGKLSEKEYQKVLASAEKSYNLECLALASDEANAIMVPPERVKYSLQQVAERYEDSREFLQDLHNNGLDEDSLSSALYRELKFDGVMQVVAARAADVNDVDVHLFYEINREKFESPEVRTANHILITINPEYPENTFDQALARMNELSQKLAGRGNRFKEFARRYSECPTALDGGKLGHVPKGRLYPELDEMLFSMEAGEISPVIESEVGFHLLYCEKIHVRKKIPFRQAEDKIRANLQARQVRHCQKAWLRSLASGCGHV